MSRRPSGEDAVEAIARRVGEGGFSLMEVIVATAIATLAVVGLAFTFGNGQGLIHRFEVARAALASAQERMEMLEVLAPSDPALAPGIHSEPFVMNGKVLGTRQWTVTFVDDPLDGLGGADDDGNVDDLRHANVEVIWQTTSIPDTVRLSRYFTAS